MKIAISCHPTTGGSGIVATELAIALAHRGHQVHVVSYERPFRLVDHPNLHFHPVNVLDYPLFKYPPHDFCLANALAEVAVAHDIDVIHAHYAVPNAVSAILADQLVPERNLRVVATMHGTDITLVGSHRDFFRVCRYAMIQAHSVTAVSKWLRDETMAQFDLPVDPVVIPNFVDCDRFGAKGRAGDEDAQVVQLRHASNFRPVKRVFDVIRVFAEVRQRMPARLVMVGEGPQRGMAEELACQLGVGKDVSFRGATKDIGDIYRSSHAFLLLSDYESFGLSALEAMACGTPVVVSDAGGLREVVEEGQAGHLCPVGDIQAITNAVVSIIEDKATWQYMSDAAVRSAKERFCKDRIIPQYEALYRKLIDQPRT